MKTLLLITIIVLSVLYTTQAQTDSLVKGKIYHIWIKPIETGRIKHGFLYEVKDSSLTIVRSYNLIERSKGKFDLTKIDIRNIDVVNLRHKNRKGLGILIGGLSGVAVGVLVGYLVSNTHSDNLKTSIDNTALSVSLAGLIIGFGFMTGSAIGGAKISIPIEGDKEQFDQNKSMLNDYSIKYNPGLGGVKTQTFSKLHDKVVDVDSNVYHTLALGGQVWMAKDLKVTHYRDGSDIQNITQDVLKPGCKYDWFAIQDSRKLCPAGWHIPSFTEWTSLYNSLGGKNFAGDVLEKDFSTMGKGQICQWWSSTERDANHAQSLYLDNKTIGIMITSTDKNSGLSVRCIRDY